MYPFHFFINDQRFLIRVCQAFDALLTPTSNYETLPDRDVHFDPNAPFILTPSSIPSDVMHPLIGARLPFLAQDQSSSSSSSYATRAPQSEPRSFSSHPLMASDFSPHWSQPQWKAPLQHHHHPYHHSNINTNVLTPVSVSTSTSLKGPHNHNHHRNFPAHVNASAAASSMSFTPSLPPPPEWQEYHYRAPARPSRSIVPSHRLTEASSSLVGWDRLADPTSSFAKDPPGISFRRV